MTQVARIRTTIPPRTYGAGRKASTPSAILLRMSFLELERQRRVQETAQMQARSIKLAARIEQIDREKATLRQALDGVVEPTAASANGVPVVRAPHRPAAITRPRGGFAIRY
jgi:hypothetical protein